MRLLWGCWCCSGCVAFNDANQTTMTSNTSLHSLFHFVFSSLSAPVHPSVRLNNSRPFSGLDRARLLLNRSADWTDGGLSSEWPRPAGGRRQNNATVNRTRTAERESTDNGRAMVDACRRIPTSVRPAGRPLGERGSANGPGRVGGFARGDYTRFHWSLSVVVKSGPRAAIGATRDEFWFTKTNSGIIDLMSNRNGFVRSSQPIAANSRLLIQRRRRVDGRAWRRSQRRLTWDSALSENNEFVSIIQHAFSKLLAPCIRVETCLLDVFVRLECIRNANRWISLQCEIYCDYIVCMLGEYLTNRVHYYYYYF